MTTPIPTVHLNGTDYETLHRQYENACESLREALVDVARMAPHGRDYHVQGPTAIDAAINAHVNRLKILTDLIMELETAWAAFEDANHETAEKARKRKDR